jgi:Predicted nucleoside-diphosphate-sugar epimerases
MITVMGATGNTGKKITKALLGAGENVRALGRSESKLAELKREGAEVLAGDTNDGAFLAKTFHGADAVYTLLPTDPRAADYRAEQDRQGEAIEKAIRESRVRFVVALLCANCSGREISVIQRRRAFLARRLGSRIFRTSNFPTTIKSERSCKPACPKVSPIFMSR